MATTTFDNLITFSRGSNATVTGPNGLIQWAPNNLLTFSEQFDNAGWTKNNVTITANSTVAPDGTTTADTLDEGTATANHAVFSPGATLVSNLNYAASIYLKAGTARWAQMPLVAGAFGSNAWANFDLVDGVVGNVGSAVVSATITSVGNGWYRCVVVAPSTLSGSGGSVQVGFTDNTNSATRLPSYTGTSKTVFAWGAQLELGSTATTYNNTSVRNLLGFSEAFDDGGWVKTRCSIVTGAQANPVNGLFNAQKLMEDTTNNNHWMRRSGPAGTYMLSVYAKAAGRSFIQLAGLATNTDFATFNLATGTVDSVGSTVSNASITPVGNGWYRVAANVPVNATGATIAIVSTAGAGWLPPYTGDGNSGVYIYGAQLSNSASLDPYAPTPGAAPSSTAYYGPRFDYDPVTLLPRGLLIEEQRVNSLTYSADFTNAAWTKSSCTVTANQGTAPDGTNTLTLLQFSAQFGRLQQGSLTSGTVYTFSIWCRVASGTRVYSLYDAAGNPLGSFTATTTLTRYSVTFTAPATSTLYAVQDRNAGPFVDTFIWGAQLEAGAFATSYIPTIASTVTRSADVAAITGSLFSQWYNGVEGSFIASATMFGATSDYLWQVEDTDNSGGAGFIEVTRQAGPVLNAFMRDDGGSNVVSLNASFTPGTTFNHAFAVKTNDTAACLNGGAVGTDTVCTMPTGQDGLFLGRAAAGANRLNGHIRSIRYVPVRAADFQLQQVTT